MVAGGWIQWNVDPVNIDAHPERNWDWVRSARLLRWAVRDPATLPPIAISRQHQDRTGRDETQGRRRLGQKRLIKKFDDPAFNQR